MPPQEIRTSRQAKGKTHAGPSHYTKRAPRQQGQATADGGEGRATKLPVPAAVIAQALGTNATATDLHSDTNLVHSIPTADIEVEVETRQGYTYNGRLIDIDAHYNLLLQGATVRRERACDVERELIRRQQTVLLASLGPQASHELAPAMERLGAPTRPRLVGSLLLRSSNLVLVRFVGATAARPTPREEGGVTAASARPGPVDLLHAFRAMAVTAKCAVQDRRRKAREERRRRLAAAKAARKS